MTKRGDSGDRRPSELLEDRDVPLVERARPTSSTEDHWMM
jgi:hypothetical protein